MTGNERAFQVMVALSSNPYVMETVAKLSVKETEHILNIEQRREARLEVISDTLARTAIRYEQSFSKVVQEKSEKPLAKKDSCL